MSSFQNVLMEVMATTAVRCVVTVI